MSIVAWDGKTLAADCMAVNAGMKIKVSKIRAIPERNAILAITGVHEHFEPLIDWWYFGKEEYPAFQATDDWSRLIVWHPTELVVFERTPYKQVVTQPFMAWGSGRDFAIGAMANGASARAAVKIANEYADSCGFGIESFDVLDVG